MSNILNNLAGKAWNFVTRSNQAVNGNAGNVGDLLSNAQSIGEVLHGFVGAGDYKGFAKDADRVKNKKWYEIASDITDENGNVTGHRLWDGRSIAGGVVGASALGRLATGGGVYKDANGNTDIIGVPFI